MALRGYYAASSSNFLPTLRDHISVPSSGYKSAKGFLNTEDLTERLSRNVGKKYSLRNNPKERSFHINVIFTSMPPFTFLDFLDPYTFYVFMRCMCLAHLNVRDCITTIICVK
jgi:hypothetical protein